MSESRERLALIAQNIVQNGGLRGLSFRTLAQQAGIKSSSVHYHFPEKSDLAQVLIQRYNLAMVNQLNDLSERNLNLRRTLTAFVGIFEEVASNDQMCLCGMMAAELDVLSDENRLALNQFFVTMEQWLKQQLDKHRDSVIVNLSSAKLANAVVSGLEGALLVDRVAQDHKRILAQKQFILSIVR